MSVVLALAAALASPPANAEPPAYLFDALQRRSPYVAAWERLLKVVQPEPDWLREFARSFDGVSGALTEVEIDGKRYLMSFVCKPTDCAAHKFTVLFEASGAHAFGALGGKDAPPAFFGAPGPAEQDALAKGF